MVAIFIAFLLNRWFRPQAVTRMARCGRPLSAGYGPVLLFAPFRPVAAPAKISMKIRHDQ